ncbi:hypothetical protein BJ138DRAFT_1009742 [Hygrophoropsis aurantiaca]|uniref:Uncharacterized protein n=1 Tax=Hygrophoropsis aurantiaca TaxID=72124 RepID=A0ACB8A9T2_9AGAM|nr:hypothetical protein BJ138DRAFT_1009742 [Hygrophoropsis aurantiaca]
MQSASSFRSSSLSRSSSFTALGAESRRNRSSNSVSDLRSSSLHSPEGSHHSRQRQQWLSAARESTAHFKSHGSPLPLVWILVEDNRIPPNAVPFEKDRNGCPLFIARALIEGELHIGRAAPHLTGGALISYGGRERTIKSYEVLVCASQLRWGIAEPPTIHSVYPRGTVILAQQQPVGHPTGQSHYPGLQQHFDQISCSGIKTVILVDDSLSMEGVLWSQAREAVGGIADLANKYGSKGIDLFFLHQDGLAPNLKTKQAIEELFDSVTPDGEDTPTAFKLEQIINHYLPFLETKNSTHEPITIIVLTDGVATDHEDLPHRIVETAHRLENHGIGHDKFGIQFVQIGNDPEAAAALHELDDHLAEQYKIRDIVDATPFDPIQGAFDTEYMVKILLGSINKELDAQPTSLFSPVGSGLGSAQARPPLITQMPSPARSAFVPLSSPGTPARKSAGMMPLPRHF